MGIKIMIADDHSMIREGIRKLLELDKDLEVVCEASEGNGILEMLIKFSPDILLLDINMPGKNGLKVLELIKKRGFKTKTLMLTIHNEIEYLIKAVEIGCDGYILKDSNSILLKKAIHSVYNGDTYIQPSLAPLLRKGMIDKNIENDKLDELTKREIEILILLVEGLFNKEIAMKLSISDKTVKNHISNIFKKIGVSDRTQAAVFAIKSNLVDIKNKSYF